MSCCFRSLRSVPIAVLFAAFLLPAFGQAPETAEEKKMQPRARFICVAALAEDHELILATRDEEGKWLELGPVKLRSSFITDWMPAKAGQLHLTVRDGETLKSIGQFNYPAGARRALVVLLPDKQKNTYNAFVVDPEKPGFAKGSVLAVNFSTQTGMLVLGKTKVTVPSGQRVVAKPSLEDNGMYRFMVAYQDAGNKPVVCYDRYVSGNPDAREMLFLFPDQTLGLRVFSLPVFGELD
jgi:hypothetical protein